MPSSYHSLLYPFNDNNVGHNRQQQLQQQSSLPLLQNNRFYAVLGEPGHLECLIESIPEPLAITWIHNGQIFVAKSPGNIPTNIDIREEIIQEQPVYRRLSFDIRQTFEVKKRLSSILDFLMKIFPHEQHSLISLLKLFFQSKLE